MQTLKNIKLKNWIAVLVLLIGATVSVVAMQVAKVQPSGGDVWGHLYKSQVMYENIKAGNFYPLFDLKWYNGIQLYRYWPPLSYYIMTVLLFATKGHIVYAYHLLTGVIFFFGGLPWVLWGNGKQRRVLGVLLGYLWFFMPEILRIYYRAGNMPQMITTTLVGYIIFFLHRYVNEKKERALVGLYLFMLLLTLSHLMVAAIMGMSAFVYLVIDNIKNKNWKRDINALWVMVLGIMSAGIWMIPALKGGLVSSESGGDSVMSTLIYPFSTSLNPMHRLTYGREDYYFGLSVIVISAVALLIARSKYKAGFIFCIVIMAFTTPATYNILVKLPFSQLFWMTRFSPMMYGFFFAALLEWNRVKKRYLVLLVALLLADLSPSVMMKDYITETPDTTIQDVTLLRENTNQRASVIDLSAYGCYPSFGISGDDGVNYSFGWAWQGAATGSNIVLLNEALESGDFLYLFDRSVELGDDTVLIQKMQVEKSNTTKEELVAAAKRSGYSLKEETLTGYLFKKSTPKQFGVKSTYQGIAIGKYAKAMTLSYPAFCTGTDTDIDSYQFNELKDYQVIFLSGFTYKDREKAEQLLHRLSDAGVRVVIDTTHMQASGETKQEEFLGVLNQPINFTNQYPTLQLYGENLNTGRFLEEDKNFTTGYISHLDQVYGTFQFEDRKLTFFGKNNSDKNIYYLGLNVMYYMSSTKDRVAEQMLNQIFGLTTDVLPKRELVDLTVTYQNNELTITSPENGVNTTIAYQDNFMSSDKISEENNLLVVEEGKSRIKLVYPMFWYGLLVSLVGLFGFVVTVSAEWIVTHKRKQTPSPD